MAIGGATEPTAESGQPTRLDQPDKLKGKTDTHANSDAPRNLVSLPILSEITSAQATHGLKHSDYERYRHYCTRRLSRIRKTTQLTNRHQSHGHRYAAKPVTSDAVQSDHRALLIPLVLAERDWAFAMDVKRTQPAGPHRARRRVLARLHRAVFHADSLSALARTVADEATVLEAEAYAQGLRAALALEQEAWAAALAAYQVVERVYTGMAGMRTGTSMATLYERKLEEITQAMRFCKYNLARSSGNGDTEQLLITLRSGAADASSTDAIGEKIEAALAEARRRAAVSFGKVSWCGLDIALRSERVREVVLMAEEENRAFMQRSHAVDEYDKLFVVFNDATKVVSDELSEFRSAASNADDRINELESLMAYLTYHRLQRTIERNLLLVESLKLRRASKPEDFVRLYDTIIGNLTDILALRGVEEDAAISNDAEARRRVYQAHRCFHLAQCYHAAALQNEAAALFDRVGVHAKSLTGKYAEEAHDLLAQSIGMKCRAKAEAFLHSLQNINGLENLSIEDGEDRRDPVVLRKTMMINHMDEFRSFVDSERTVGDKHGSKNSGAQICDMPPALEAVACKPVMFDLAVDGVRLPSKEDESAGQTETKSNIATTETTESIPAEEKKSGFASITSTRLGRWWSGTS